MKSKMWVFMCMSCQNMSFCDHNQSSNKYMHICVYSAIKDKVFTIKWMTVIMRQGKTSALKRISSKIQKEGSSTRPWKTGRVERSEEKEEGVLSTSWIYLCIKTKPNQVLSLIIFLPHFLKAFASLLLYNLARVPRNRANAAIHINRDLRD